MAQAVVTIKIMPTSPEVDLTSLEASIKNKIKAFCGETETRTTIKPIAFGLSAIEIIFVMDEAQGSTEPLEKEIEVIEGVNSVETVDVRRALG